MHDITVTWNRSTLASFRVEGELLRIAEVLYERSLTLLNDNFALESLHRKHGVENVAEKKQENAI